MKNRHFPKTFPKDFPNASRKASGFTLVEIAIVLVIIGLLIGGVLKGQELINNAKVKNIGNDFRNAQVMLYGYQDKFRRLPGDDNTAVSRWQITGGHEGNGNGVINGRWNSENITDESILVWEHLRRANLATGSTDFASFATAALPSNAEGGRFGVSGERPLVSMPGSSFYACSDSIDGKLALQLDINMDDGKPDAGSLQAIAQANGTSQATGAQNASPDPYADGTRYTVCMSY
ncbi:MAG: prepilin-type N-terminal cleavage/methylation domain-containing protein [Zoogloeaceae bacterium]|jgi:prepilin-type N-terminal cleavage/methylation domain-containing protein|nr:prepilin-type N-terminal cleavage/methylation domain-containing protein [Zoogloeaceae bacterium]